MFAEISYVASILIAVAIYLQYQNSRRLRGAENNMAKLMHVALTRDKLEDLRDDLLKLKGHAIEVGFEPMERIYEIEHKMNLVAIKLDQIERNLIEQGLQQPSEKGRVAYMLKLVDLSIAVA